MEYPKLYLEWVKYLKEKKLYGAWLKDVATYAKDNMNPNSSTWTYYYDDSSRLWAYTSQGDSVLLINKNREIDSIISSFGNLYAVKCIITYFTAKRNTIKIWGNYNTTSVEWGRVFEDYLRFALPQLFLTPKLSRKLARNNGRHESKTKYKEIQEEPWYNRGRNRAYNKGTRIWRR